jgi:rhodanese-related sulfurtransferase
MSLLSSISNLFEHGGGNPAINHISADEFHKKLESDKSLFLLDVREPHELKSPIGHLRGSKNIPMGDLKASVPKIMKHKDDEVAVICHSGMRARTAAKILQAAGFTRIIVLDGGMAAYRKHGY